MKTLIIAGTLPLLMIPGLVGAQGIGVDLETSAEIRTQNAEARAEARAEAQAEREERRGEATERFEERKAELLEARAEIRARLETNARERVGNAIDRITNKFEQVFDRLSDASTNIEARISTLEERGIDMTESLDLLATAEAELDTASEILASVVVDLEAELEAEEVSRDNIRALVDVGRQALRDVHQAFQDVTISVKASVETETSVE